MQNAGRDQVAGVEVGDQQILAFAPAFRGYEIAAFAIAGKGVSGADGHHIMPRIA